MDMKFALIETITNNFSEDRKVGSGGYGNVYKAVNNGEDIAVKKLHPLQGFDDKRFHNEVGNLTKVSHKNIVRLIGYCYESQHKYVQHNGEDVWAHSVERVLCFEYMHGGTLDKHIRDESCGLNWHTCYNIIRGTCEGLNYLHRAHKNPIFHLDLKPDHILLDKNMTPKIAGLSLSGVFDSSQTHKAEFLQGTLGYMPPEYLDNHSISNKYDVFSLGVIILKMMFGHIGYFRYFEMPPEHFIEHASQEWTKRLQEMPGLYSSHEIDILRVSTCTEIASRCVDRDQEKRPCIQDIVDELEELEAVIRKMGLPSHEPKDLILQENTNMGQARVLPRVLAYHLLEEMTNGFSVDRELGRGTYGKVYLGLHDNGGNIAVKMLHPMLGLDDQQFEKEYHNLERLQHPNIVRLVGYCNETRREYVSFDGKRVLGEVTHRALCFEHMPGGSLDNCLSGKVDGATC